MQMLLLICIIRSGGVDADVFISAMLMNKSFLKGRLRKRERGREGKEPRGVALWRAKLEALRACFTAAAFPPLVVLLLFLGVEGLRKTCR